MRIIGVTGIAQHGRFRLFLGGTPASRPAALERRLQLGAPPNPAAMEISA